MSDPKPTETDDISLAREAAAAREEAEQVRERALITSRELRRRRARRIAAVTSFWVGLPTLLAAIYYGLIASPQYDSVAIIAVEWGGHEGSGGPSDRAQRHDLEQVRYHLLSRDTVAMLDRDHGLGAHYKDGDIDWWSRLDADAGAEETYDYFHKKVRIASEGSAGTLTLRVRAFSPESAREFATSMIGAAETFLATLSTDQSNAVLAPAQKALEEAEARARRAAADTSPPPAQDAAAASVDPTGTTARDLERQMAHEQLAVAMRGMDQARSEAVRQQRHLEIIAAPSLADARSMPRPLWSITSVFVTAAALLGVIWLLIAAVREHAKF